MERDLRAEGCGPEDCYPETTEGLMSDVDDDCYGDEMDWIRVEDELPPARSKVIAFYYNSHGRRRMVFAEFIPRWTVLAEDYFDHESVGNTEWTHDGEQEFVAESWHELVDNWGDFSGCEITEGVVTHWMPKPLPPSA